MNTDSAVEVNRTLCSSVARSLMIFDRQYPNLSTTRKRLVPCTSIFMIACTTTKIEYIVIRNVAGAACHDSVNWMLRQELTSHLKSLPQMPLV